MKQLARGISFDSADLKVGSGGVLAASDARAAQFAKAHDQNTDTKLAQGTGNEVTAAAIRAFIDSKAANSGLASLDSSGKIPTGQIPNLALTSVNVVASQAAMLALTAEAGDVAIRTDTNESYMLAASPASTLANWKLLSIAANAVTSVNGETGAVTLTSDEIGYDGTTSGLSADDVKGAIDELDGRLDTAETDIDGVQSDVTTLEDNVMTLQASVSSLDGEFSTLQSDLSTLQSDLWTVQSDLSNLTTMTIPGIQSDVSDLDTRIDVLEARKIFKREFKSLTSGQVAAKSVTLAQTPSGTVNVHIRGIGPQWQSDGSTLDFAVITDTGTSSIDWNNGEGMDSLSLAAGDRLLIEYEYAAA